MAQGEGNLGEEVTCWTLDDASLDSRADSVVALVGKNGASTTTLLELMSKLYEPIRGRILVVDAEFKRTPADGWREALAGHPGRGVPVTDRPLLLAPLCLRAAHGRGTKR